MKTKTITLLFTIVLVCCGKETKQPIVTQSAPKSLGHLAVAIHIGVKRLSPTHYGHIDPLYGAANDATAMQSIATANGFTTAALLLNENATTTSVQHALEQAAALLNKGDTLLLTFSGHGCLFPDGNGDETSGYDTSWCLYDRALVDDEVYMSLLAFQPGVHILVISDSCHSGTPVTIASRNQIALVTNKQLRFGIKQLTRKENADVYLRNKQLYDGIQQKVPGKGRPPIKASVVVLSACQDNQVTEDGSPKSAFTAKVLDLWDNGLFAGTLESFYTTLLAQSDNKHKPNFDTVGQDDHLLQHTRPFTPVKEE